MKKVKIISIILLVFVVLFTFSNIAFATNDVNTIGDNIIFKVGKDNSGASASLAKIISAILNMVQIIGVGVATIMLIVLAIKYISAAPNDKAEIKKHAVVYVVGAVILFSAAGILQIIKNFAGNIQDESNTTNGTVYENP